MLLEVAGNALEEGISSNPGHQLLEHRSSLGVGDSVKVDLDVFQIVDGCNDWVSGGKLVLAIGPVLLKRCEGGPGLFPLTGFCGGKS